MRDQRAIMLKAITFDFWGTLYDNLYARDERLQLLSEQLTLHRQSHTPDDLEVAYKHAHTAWERVWREERRAFTFEEWLDQILTSLNVTIPQSAIDELRDPIQGIYLQGKAPQPVPGVAEALNQLSRRYQIGLISDTGLTPGVVLKEVIRRDGLLTHFDALTFSDEIGVTKPEPEPFLHTLDALQARPEQSVHVGDLPETDIVGAQGVGMTAILFLGVSQRRDGLAVADASFETYDELADILKGLQEGTAE